MLGNDRSMTFSIGDCVIPWQFINNILSIILFIVYNLEFYYLNVNSQIRALN